MDSRALKDRAHRHFARGHFAKSADIYVRLCAAAPADPSLRLRHAEAARRSNNTPAAISSYRTAARLLLEHGHAARARGALRLALEVAPGHPEILRALEAMKPQPSASINEALESALTREPEIHVEVEAPQPMHSNVLALPLPPNYQAPVSTAAPYQRIGSHTIAFRRPDGRGWWVVQSETELSMTDLTVDEDLEVLVVPGEEFESA